MKTFFKISLFLFLALLSKAQDHNTIELPKLEGLHLLDEVVRDYNFFFSGEGHGTKMNSVLESELLEYLHNKVGIRYFLCECNYSTAYLFDLYLKTGQEKYLEPAIIYADEKFFLDKIRALNSTLDKENQIQIIGVDAERFPKALVATIKILTQKHAKELNLGKELIGRIDSLKPYHKKDLHDVYVALHNQIKFDKALKKAIGEEDWRHLSNVINPPSYHEDRFEFILTEEAKYKNLLAVLSNLPKGKIYSQHGTYHLNKGKNTFSGILNRKEDSPYQNKVLTIGTFYMNSFFSFRGKTEFAKKEGLLFVNVGKLKKYKKDKSFILLDTETLKQEKIINLTDRYHFLVLIRGSKAAVSYVSKETTN